MKSIEKLVLIVPQELTLKKDQLNVTVVKLDGIRIDQDRLNVEYARQEHMRLTGSSVIYAQVELLRTREEHQISRLVLAVRRDLLRIFQDQLSVRSAPKELMKLIEEIASLVLLTEERESLTVHQLLKVDDFIEKFPS